MAVSGDQVMKVKDFQKLVECNLCLETLTNPKDLDCHHSYCKSCIEEIMEFRDDKTAVVRCPMRCEKETIIKADKTVNDLATSFHLKSIIEHLNAVQNPDQAKHRCFNSPECNRIACYYCVSCLMKMCHVCKPNHTHGKESDTNGFVWFKCNEKDHEELLPWCNEHSTYATFKCEEGFICHYCKWRSHAEHNFHEIDTLYDEFYTWIMNQHPQVENLEELLKICHVRSTDEAKRIKGILRREIRIRKQVSLEKYIEMLNLEEEELLKTFDSLIGEHLTAYPLSSPHDYISHKSKFEVLVQRENIFDKVKNITGENVMLPQLSIEYANDTTNNTKPLGMIYGQESIMELMEGVVTVRNEITESKFNFERLNVLLEELNLKEIEKAKTSHVDHVSNYDDVENKQKTADINKTTDESRERKVAAVMKIFRKNGIDIKSKLFYLMGLMEKKDIETFGILLDKLPGELLGLRNNDGDKLIHIASHCENVTFIKRLIGAGEHVDCKGNGGWTPLHYAACCGNTNMVKLLIDNNADMLVKSNGGGNAIDKAKCNNHPHTVKYLQDVLKGKGKVDDGRHSNMTIEQMKRRGWGNEEKYDWWNNMKEQLKP